MKFTYFTLIGLILTLTEKSQFEASVSEKNSNSNKLKTESGSSNKAEIGVNVRGRSKLKTTDNITTAATTATAKTDLEFFNSLFMNNSNPQFDNMNNNLKVAIPGGTNISGPTMPNTGTSIPNTTPNIGNPNNPVANTQDWLMISSPSFKDSKVFPEISSPSGPVTVPTDLNNFRINTGFRPDNTDRPPNDKCFWFRLVGSNLYYSSTKTDYNILHSFNIQALESVDSGTNADFCITIRDHKMRPWTLCALDAATKEKWTCALKNCLKVPITMITQTTTPAIPQNLATNGGNKIQPLIIIPVPSPHCNQGWNYKNRGQDWNCDCAEGRAQSPIDLPDKFRAIDSQVKPIFAYQEVSFKSNVNSFDGFLKAGENLKIRYMANSLRIIHHNMGKLVTMDGAIYHAEEIAIHTPAEHTLQGKQFDMEIQIIHYGQTVGDIAKQVVLSFLFEKVPGVGNKFIDDIDVNNLPNPINSEIDIINNIFIPRIFYSTDDKDNAVMKPFSFYTYQGSLTAPPCTESTIMYVASKPLQIGTTALTLIQEAIRVPDLATPSGEVITPGWRATSSRQLQPLNGRPVFFYDHAKYVGPDPVIKHSEAGHYEKVNVETTKYFYVSGDKPSQVPGAIVVDETQATSK
jgi:carbonic anhydrase